jgi:hypothetical protein
MSLDKGMRHGFEWIGGGRRDLWAGQSHRKVKDGIRALQF